MYIFSLGFGILLVAIFAEARNPNNPNGLGDKDIVPHNPNCVAQEEVLFNDLRHTKCRCRRKYRQRYLCVDTKEWVCALTKEGKRLAFYGWCEYTRVCCEHFNRRDITLVNNFTTLESCTGNKNDWISNNHHKHMERFMAELTLCHQPCNETYAWMYCDYGGMRTLFENACLMDRYNYLHNTAFKNFTDWYGLEKDCPDCAVGRDTPRNIKWTLNITLF